MEPWGEEKGIDDLKKAVENLKESAIAKIEAEKSIASWAFAKAYAEIYKEKKESDLDKLLNVLKLTASALVHGPSGELPSSWTEAFKDFVHSGIASYTTGELLKSVVVGTLENREAMAVGQAEDLLRTLAKVDIGHAPLYSVPKINAFCSYDLDGKEYLLVGEENNNLILCSFNETTGGWDIISCVFG